VKLVLATRNEHKRREFARLFDAHAEGVMAGGRASVAAKDGGDAEGDRRQRTYLLTLLPDGVVLPPEDGESFAENALGKARAAARATGETAIADDSGIEAEALGGAPGIRSARYAGEEATDEENLRKLLREAPAGSALRYVCALAYVDPHANVERVFEGACRGRLAETPRGSRGFGYDPAFLPEDEPSGVTMAELTEREKDEISHRGRAVRELVRWLESA
jgi:XTP/dITP diphosphohydrolase